MISDDFDRNHPKSGLLGGGHLQNLGHPKSNSNPHGLIPGFSLQISIN